MNENELLVTVDDYLFPACCYHKSAKVGFKRTIFKVFLLKIFDSKKNVFQPYNPNAWQSTLFCNNSFSSKFHEKNKTKLTLPLFSVSCASNL